MGEKRYILEYCQEAVYLFMLDSLYFLRLTGYASSVTRSRESAMIRMKIR